MSIGSSSPICSEPPPSISQEPTSSQRYIFVQHSDNVNASSTRRAVRSHAMSAVRRLQRQESAKPSRLKWPSESSAVRTIERKQPDGQSTSQSAEPIEIQLQDGEAVRGTPLPETSKPLNSGDGDSSQSMDPQSSIGPTSESPRSTYFSERQDSQPYTTLGVDEGRTPDFDHLQTFLGAGRSDPFQTSSIHINRGLAELIDHYLTIMPATFYGVRCRKPVHIDLYRTAIGHGGSMHALAAFASKSLDFLHSSETSPLTLEHTMRAIQSVNKALLATDEYQPEGDDDIILSIALLAFAELRFGRKDIAHQHWIGLREVVRYRGGFRAVRCNHRLKAVMAWNSSVCSTGRYRIVLGSSDLPSFVAPDTSADLGLTCQKFIEFFLKLNDNAYSHSVYSDPSDSTHKAYPYKFSGTARRKSLFAAGSPLCSLLSSNLDGSMGLAQQRAADACQMPCLFYINAVILEYARGPYLIDDFFAKLNNVVYEDNLDTCFSPEQLLIRLFVGIEGTEAVRDARLCEVTKFIYVAKRLGMSSMDKVRSALWRNLVLSDGPCRKEPLFDWDPVMFEAEILRE